MSTVIIQQAINGIVLGSLYVIVALGLTLIYGVLVQINFAHADVVTIGAFAAYFFTFNLGGNYIVSIAVALLVFFAIYFVWYPHVLFEGAGGRELFLLIASVDGRPTVAARPVGAAGIGSVLTTRRVARSSANTRLPVTHAT